MRRTKTSNADSHSDSSLVVSSSGGSETGHARNITQFNKTKVVGTLLNTKAKESKSPCCKYIHRTTLLIVELSLATMNYFRRRVDPQFTASSFGCMRDGYLAECQNYVAGAARSSLVCLIAWLVVCCFVFACNNFVICSVSAWVATAKITINATKPLSNLKRNQCRVRVYEAGSRYSTLAISLII